MLVADMSKSTRRDRLSYWLAQYAKALTAVDRETVRVKFFDAFKGVKVDTKVFDPKTGTKVTVQAFNHEGFNTRMAVNLRVVGKQRGPRDTVDAAFEKTVRDIFALAPMPTLYEPTRRGRTR